MVGGWQYPGEKEITFPPFTCLESHGDPRLEQTKEGELIIFPLKASTLLTHPRSHQRQRQRQRQREKQREGEGERE